MKEELRMPMKKMGWALVASLLILSGSPLIWALTITPSRTEVYLAPGKQVKAEINVLNEAKDPVQVEVSEKDWFVLPANKNITTADWLKLKGSRRFILKPGKERKVKLVIKAPKEAVGELVGMTSFRYRGEQPSMVTPMISVSVYLTLAGTDKIAGEITDLTLSVNSQERISMSANVKNTGNVHVRPSGEFTILTSTGTEVKKNYLPDSGPPTYPGSSRPYGVEDHYVPLAPGDYKVVAVLRSSDLTMTSEREFKVSTAGQIHLSDKK